MGGEGGLGKKCLWRLLGRGGDYGKNVEQHWSKKCLPKTEKHLQSHACPRNALISVSFSEDPWGQTWFWPSSSPAGFPVVGRSSALQKCVWSLPGVPDCHLASTYSPSHLPPFPWSVGMCLLISGHIKMHIWHPECYLCVVALFQHFRPIWVKTVHQKMKSGQTDRDCDESGDRQMPLKLGKGSVRHTQ